MRPFSKARAAINREVKPFRDEYRNKYPYCQFPGCDKLGQDLHELPRGVHRAGALGVASAVLHLCRAHHDQVQPMPLVAQLGIKKLSNSGYCRVLVNRLCGRADESVTELEVNDWIVRGKLSGHLGAARLKKSFFDSCRDQKRSPTSLLRIAPRAG